MSQDFNENSHDMETFMNDVTPQPKETSLPRLYNQAKKLIILQKFAEGRQLAIQALEQLKDDTVQGKRQEYVKALERLALLSTAHVEEENGLPADELLNSSRRLSTVDGRTTPTTTLLVVNSLLTGDKKDKVRLQEAKQLLEKTLADLPESFNDLVASGSEREQKLYQQMMELYVIHVLRPLEQTKLAEQMVDFSLLDSQTKEVYKSILSRPLVSESPEKPVQRNDSRNNSQRNTSPTRNVAPSKPTDRLDSRDASNVDKEKALVKAEPNVMQLFQDAWTKMQTLPPVYYVTFLILLLLGHNRRPVLRLLRRLFLKFYATAKMGMTVR